MGEELIQKREQAAAPTGEDKICQMHNGGNMPVDRRFNRKMRRLFLVGMLCGVMITAAITYVFALPANNYYWKMEIWKRGGAAFTIDRNGHAGWKWLVEPATDAPRQKRVIAPPAAVKVNSEQL